MATEETKDVTTASATAPISAPAANTAPKPDRGVLLVPYPKFVFFYPTAIAALVCGLVLYFTGFREVVAKTDTVPVVMTAIFLGVITINLVVVVFDFPRSSSLTLFFVVSTFALLVWLLLIFKPGILPVLESTLLAIRPVANSTFFFCFFIIQAVFYVAVLISTRFDYWELSANELIHHHGMWSNMKRYPAPNLRVDKEVNDLFEYLLLGAGRLVLHPAGEERAIVLDNVLFVDSKEQQLSKLLGAITVNIQTTP